MTTAKYYSQGGEDEAIKAKLTELALRDVPLNQHCFEVGAADGIKLSNTRHFLELGGWRALLIESDPVACAALRDSAIDGAICVHAQCDANVLEACLDAARFPQDPDFGVIDIDGEDYYLWMAFTRYRPKIMCVEHGAATDGDVLPPPGQSKPATYQAGRNRVRDLGLEKGYEVFYENGVNLVFADKRIRSG